VDAFDLKPAVSLYSAVYLQAAVDRRHQFGIGNRTGASFQAARKEVMQACILATRAIDVPKFNFIGIDIARDCLSAERRLGKALQSGGTGLSVAQFDQGLINAFFHASTSVVKIVYHFLSIRSIIVESISKKERLH